MRDKRRILIKNGIVFEKNATWSKKDVQITGGIICGFESNVDSDDYDEVIDASDKYVIPGLIDIHLHGCMGHDFCDGTIEAISEIAKYEWENGITSMCLASMTLDEDRLKRIFACAAAYGNDFGARLIGINMEGPFISPKKIGSQNPEYIRRPDVECFERLQKTSNGLIKLVDIAPEVEGADDFINAISNKVIISLAHTCANYTETMRAFDGGVNHVTHLYNAMPAFGHRNPGVVGAALDSKDVYVELITDGIHVDGSVVRATFKMFGDDRIVLISDSIESCGMPDGEYELGGQKVYVRDKKATLADGTLAGSNKNLMECVRVAAFEMGIPIAQVIKCATVNPAKSIGVFDEVGSIDIGKRADILICDGSRNWTKNSGRTVEFGIYRRVLNC